MPNKILSYLSHHAIAILALVCSLLALAGASYAAIQLPKNSVGNAQIKQGAVTPSKLSGTQFGGYVRLYAVIGRNGKLTYSNPQAKLVAWHESASTPTGGEITWPAAVSKRCQATVTPLASVEPTPVTASLNTGRAFGTTVTILMSGESGAVVAVVC